MMVALILLGKTIEKRRHWQRAVEQSITSVGANTVLVLPGAASTAGVTFGVGTVQTLTHDDADEIARRCTGVSAVAPIAIARTHIIYGNLNWVPVTIQGTSRTTSTLATGNRRRRASCSRIEMCAAAARYV
jgi:hypothetical protein